MHATRRQLHHLFLTALAIVLPLVLAPAAQAATLGCSDEARGTTDLSTWVPEMLEATNAHRATLGLVPLRLDPTLGRASAWKARDLAVRGYFAHDDPAGSDGEPGRTPWQRLVECGFTAGGARAENIAAGQPSGASFVQAWIESPGHRANIENASMRYVGFGVARLDTSAYRTYAVQMFSSLPGPAAEDGLRTPLGGGTDSGGEPAASRIVAGATLSSHRCRSRLAVRGTCHVLTVHGRVLASDPAALAGRTVVGARRLATGRWTRFAVTRTSAAGTFTIRRVVRPPARGTRTWLLRNARLVRVTTTPTSAGTAAASIVAARLRR